MKFNTQQPLPFVELEHLQVNSIFATIQGEGPFSGHRAVFVRLAGCNLQCPGCDTEYTESTDMTSEQIFAEIEEVCTEAEWQDVEDGLLIVITGGEPFRQKAVIKLLHELVDYGYYTQVETNGTYSCEGIPDETVIVCSPKTGSVHKSIAHRANAYKYVVSETSFNPEDMLPIRVLRHSVAKEVARPPERHYRGVIYVQPADPQDDDAQYLKNVKHCVEAAQKFGYVLQLQIHKIVGVA